MSELRTAMEREALESSAVAERQLVTLRGELGHLRRRLRELDPSVVVTCARGSSDHAATYAKYLIETRAKIPAASHAPSITSIYGTGWRKLDKALYLTISQSGRSPDLLLSACAARDAGALVVALVNDASSPLAAAAHHVLPLSAGPETSVAATKSYIGSLLAIAALVSEWREDEVLRDALGSAPRLLSHAADLDWSHAIEPLVTAKSLFVIGRGMTLGIAQEAALKFKETSGIHAEAFSAAEVQHGPMALVTSGFPVLMFVPNDAASDAFEALARDFVARGATVIAAGAKIPGTISLPVVDSAHPALSPVAMIQPFYRMVANVSVARGLDPDRPPHLRKVTETR